MTKLGQTKLNQGDRAVTPDVMLKNPNSSFFLNLPQDLREWMDESNLVRCTLESVASTGPSTSNTPTGLTFLPLGQPRSICTLLTFCYAVGVYASEEIQFLSRSDRSIRYLSAGIPQPDKEIRRFRRQHQSPLQRALAALLQGVWEQRIRTLLGCSTGGESMGLGAVGGKTSAELQAYFAAAAQERIRQAVRLDSMALDS